MKTLAGFDAALFHAINSLGSGYLDPVFRFLSSIHFAIFCCGLVVVGLVLKRRGARVLPVLAALAAAVGATDLLGARVLKPLFDRVRPCYALPTGTFRWVGEAANVGSMPSLHAANFFAAAMVLALARPRWTPVVYVLASLVALSRVYLGVHWPGDVLGGALYGSLVGLVTGLALRSFGHRTAAPGATK